MVRVFRDSSTSSVLPHRPILRLEIGQNQRSFSLRLRQDPAGQPYLRLDWFQIICRRCFWSPCKWLPVTLALILLPTTASLIPVLPGQLIIVRPEPDCQCQLLTPAHSCSLWRKFPPAEIR